jgi:hypothetical protein
MSLSQTFADTVVEQSSDGVQFACHICGGSEVDQICSSEEVQAQIEFLRGFHRRRLRHPTESALKDRGEFTQEYLTDIVACRGCGLICRAMRPPPRRLSRRTAGIGMVTSILTRSSNSNVNGLNLKFVPWRPISKTADPAHHSWWRSGASWAGFFQPAENVVGE